MTAVHAFRARTVRLVAAAVLTLALAGCQPTDGGSSSSSTGGGGPVASADANPNPSARGIKPSTVATSAGVKGGTSGGVNSGGFACDVETHGSQNFSNAVAGKASVITAAVEVSCAPDGVPLQLSQVLNLEYRSTSHPDWELMSSDPKFYTLPPYSMIVGAQCQVGDWRLRITADGIDAAKLPIHVDYAWPEVFVSTCP